MKILFISQYFYPETFRGNDIAFDWAKRGDSVTVICGIPNYPKGSFFKGYGFLKKRREFVNGVSINRVCVVPRGNGSTFRLLFNYFSFALSATFYVIFTSCFKKYDAIFVQQLSPVLMSYPAVVYKRLHPYVPLFTWVLDLWPESLQAAGNINNRVVLNFFNYFVKLEYRKSDLILMSSNSFGDSICKKGAFRDKLLYFPNWAEDIFSEQHNELDDIPKLPEGFKVMFAGNVGESQDFESIMRAAELLRNEKDIKFIIVGDGRKKGWVEQYVKSHNLEETVYLLGRWPLKIMPDLFAKADVMLVSLKDEQIFSLTAPAKIQAYMQSKKPIIAMLNGEGAEIIKKSNCGVTVMAGDARALATAIKDLCVLDKKELHMMGENGYDFCEINFSKSLLLNRLYDIVSRFKNN